VSFTGDAVQEHVVEDGVCGFASVIVKPANSAFAKYLALQHGARKHYYGGISLSINDFNQSLQKKEAYAKAFAGVLVDAGINAHYESRMD
jgi:predicted nucleic acid-binding Zn finger protein